MNPFIPEPVLDWFRGLPKQTQVLVGLPTVGWLAFELVRPRPADAPQLGIFWTLVLLVATVVLTEVLRPKPHLEDARPASLGDFQFPTATEGRVVPLVWGKVRMRGPNVVWYGDLRQDPITQKVKTGLWSSKRVISGFRYFLGVQFALTRGPGCILRRIWIGETEVWSGTQSTEGTIDINLPDLFGGDSYGQGGVVARLDFYPGTTTQTVNSYLNDPARQQVTGAITPTAPRYTGTCYIVARGLPGALIDGLGDSSGAYLGNSTSIKPWSFELERYSLLFSGQSGSENLVGTDDLNPINAIYELLTNTEWGFGFSPSDIDVGPGSSFLEAANTLRTEGNGFSFLLDRSMEAKELLTELQRQIDGVVFLDHRTGKWRIKLVRADYDIDDVVQVTDSNVKEVQDFTRGSWDDTTNVIQVKFTKRSDEYKESYAVAQDMANATIAAGGSVVAPTAVTATVSYPGVMNSELASNLAWRDLRGQSYPLARVKLVVNRESWQVRIGDVVAWTNAQLGFTKLPLRVTRINYGRITDNQMTLTCVQDVFHFAAASMGTPGETGWTPPTTSLVAYPSTQQLAFEAPRGIITRDPDYAGDPNISKVLAAARRQTSEVAFRIKQRNSSGTPAGTFADAGDVVSFMRIGKLLSSLSAGTAIPTNTVTIVPDPDTQSDVETVFDDTTTLTDLGVNLTQLVLVGTELMLVQSAANNSGNVDLQNVYRGVLDTAQANHAANDPVYLIFVGSGLSDTNFPNTNNVDIELRALSSSDEFAGTVTTIALTMAKRAMRPYPPNASLYNGSSTAFGGMNVGADGSGLNGTGANISWRRRSYLATDEVIELLSDDAGVDASTEYRVRVFVLPNSTNVEVLTSSWATGVGPVFLNRLLLWDEAAAGSQIRVQIEVRHDILTETDLVSRYNLIHDLTPTSAYDALFYLGGKLRATVISNSYTAVATGTFTLRIGAAYSTSSVQVSKNGGAFTMVITAGTTSGTFSANSGDTIRVQHTVNETPSPNLVQLENPSAVVVAYGVLKN